MLTTGFTPAQIIRQPLSVPNESFGAYSHHFSDIFSAISNQASLAELKTAGFAAYAEKRFMLSELSTYTAIAAIPSSSGTYGVQANYFGYADFNENVLGILYGRKITAQVDVGVKFNYHTIHVASYGNVSAVNFEAGAIFHLSERFHAGIHIYNPTKSRFGKAGNERLASMYAVGAGYEISENVFLGSEIIKEEGRLVNVKAGLQYNLCKKIFIRTGISTNTNNSYAAVAVQLPFARIDINASYHPQLGFTPGMLILLNLKKATED